MTEKKISTKKTEKKEENLILIPKIESGLSHEIIQKKIKCPNINWKESYKHENDKKWEPRKK